MSKASRRIVGILMTLVMVFSVVNFGAVRTYAASAKVTLQGANQPTTITVGKKFNVKGKIVSNKKIKRVEIGIVKASNNKWTKYKYDNKKVNAKTFKIKKAASKLKFQKLSAGEYYYRIYVHTSSGVKTVMNTKFTVKKAQAASTASNTSSSSGSSGTSTANNTFENIIETIINFLTGGGPTNIRVTSYNCPVKYDFGTQFNVKGKITSEDVIKRVEIGIVVTGSNKWSEYKYDNAAVNANVFDIAAAASTLKFDKLPPGKFTYRIYVHTDKGVAIALNKDFEVNPTNTPQKAIAWATAIANNDKFTYGKGYGEYSQCCVCAGKTEKASDAQFTCMPFLAAAYAHGTGNLSLLNKGKAGYHYMHLNDKNFNANIGGVWFKVGLCKDLTIEDLMPGDVIIKWSDSDSSGHAWMYGGGDSIIEAVPADIRVLDSGAAAKLRRYGTTEGTPSKNYVMRFRG